MSTENPSINPYVWLVWGLPATVVVAGVITVFIAFNNADPLVSDDYYREGLAINQDKAADTRAGVLQLSANVSQHDGNFRVELHGQLIYPEQLVLSFEHPTQANQDQSLTLQHRGDGVYTTTENLSSLNIALGNWYISVSPIDKLWRLRSTGNLGEPLHLVVTQ